MKQDSIDTFENELLQIAKSIDLPIVELGVGEVSWLLNSFRKAIHNLVKNAKSEVDSNAKFSDEEILKIDCFFSELADNFFPMAHSDSPLKDLRIREVNRYEKLHGLLEREVDRVEEIKQRLEKITYDFYQVNRK